MLAARNHLSSTARASVDDWISRDSYLLLALVPISMSGEEKVLAQKISTTEKQHSRATADSRYISTYTFNGYLRGEYAETILLIRETVAEMQRDGIDIEVLETTRRINETGQLIELTAHYAAPNKGAVGQLNWRACLPASGPPQRAATDESEPPKSKARGKSPAA